MAALPFCVINGVFVFAVVVGHRLPIRRLDLTESKVRELILELQPDFVLFQQLPALVPDVQQYDLIPSNTISQSLRHDCNDCEKGKGPYQTLAARKTKIRKELTKWGKAI